MRASLLTEEQHESWDANGNGILDYDELKAAVRGLMDARTLSEVYLKELKARLNEELKQAANRQRAATARTLAKLDEAAPAGAPP